MYKQIGDVTALEVARKKMDNAAGSIEQLKGAFETLQIKALRPTLPYIKKLAEGIGDFIEKNTPAMTRGIKDAVDGANSYLHTHFIDNPDFQKLDRNAKIEFIFQDLGQSFSKWFEEHGRGMLNTAAQEITGSLATALAASSKELGEAALKVGSAIASGMVDGYKQFMTDHPVEAGVIAGLVTPGGPLVKAAVGGAVTATAVNSKTNPIDDWWSRLFGYSDAKSLLKTLQDAPDPEDAITPHAKGGFFSRPHVGLVAEAGPEAIIPLNGSSGAKNLWHAAGEKLGMNTGGIVVHFSPVIHGSGAEIIPALQQQQQNLTSEIEAIFHRQRRLSFKE